MANGPFVMKSYYRDVVVVVVVVEYVPPYDDVPRLDCSVVQ